LFDDYFIRDFLQPGSTVFVEVNNYQLQTLTEMFNAVCKVDQCVRIFLKLNIIIYCISAVVSG
jgi:hypothetical protein